MCLSCTTALGRVILVSSNHASNINVLYFNARSLAPKIDELQLICATCKPDIVCVVETWLDSEVVDVEIAIPNFSITRLDRSRHGGRIAFYTLYSQVFLKGPYDLEFLLFSVSSLNLCILGFTINT